MFTMTASAETLTLDDAIARALAHSPELRALEAAVAEARANATIADAFQPSASISATPGYASGLPTAVLGQNPAIGTIEAHRLLYDAGARVDQIGAASQIDEATAALETRKREVAQNVAEVYARLSADTALVSSAERRVAARETIAAHAEALLHEGRARELDAQRARLQVAGAKRVLLQTKSRMELDRLRLSRAVGLSDVATVRDENPSPLPLSPRDAEKAPDYMLASLDARIEGLQKAQTLSERSLQPSIGVQIQYSRLFDRFRRYYLNFKPDAFSVAATVSLPIWTGGRRAAESARINAQLQQLLAQRDARRMELELTEREAETDLAQAMEENELARKTQDVAREGLRIAEELAGEGRGEADDVANAQLALADADDDAANAQAHVVAARAKLVNMNSSAVLHQGVR